MNQPIVFADVLDAAEQLDAVMLGGRSVVVPGRARAERVTETIAERDASSPPASAGP